MVSGKGERSQVKLAARARGRVVSPADGFCRCASGFWEGIGAAREGFLFLLYSRQTNKINASASLRPVKQAQESLVTGTLKLSSTLALLFAHAFSKQLSTAVTLFGNWGGHTE